MFDAASMMGMDWFHPATVPPKVPKQTSSPSQVSTPVGVAVSPGVPLMTVDDAWRLFGFPKKRATKEDAKERYLSLVIKYHPDRHIANEKLATECTVKINTAWALLQKHCKW
jgi:hypothetical protein